MGDLDLLPGPLGCELADRSVLSFSYYIKHAKYIRRIIVNVEGRMSWNTKGQVPAFSFCFDDCCGHTKSGFPVLTLCLFN